MHWFIFYSTCMSNISIATKSFVCVFAMSVHQSFINNLINHWKISKTKEVGLNSKFSILSDKKQLHAVEKAFRDPIEVPSSVTSVSPRGKLSSSNFFKN